MYEIVVKKVPTSQVSTYSELICEPTEDMPSVYNRCHSLIALLSTNGVNNYWVNVKIVHANITNSIATGQVEVLYDLDESKQALIYDSHKNTYTSNAKIQLNLGLNVIFWCNRKIKPRAHASEEERVRYSNFTYLNVGPNVQLTPGENQVWDTYLLSEARNGYSGKTEASPIGGGYCYPFFCTDRITIARNRHMPSELLQQSWLTAIKYRVHGRGEFQFYNLRGKLPISRVPCMAQNVTFHHLMKLRDPSYGDFTERDKCCTTA
jgi:hypothetical protein